MSVFRHSVASFDPLPHGVLLWTRLSGATEVSWVVARDDVLSDVVAQGTEITGPARDHTVVLDVDGLDPATTYFYAFTTTAGERSPVGRTRTLPLTGPVDLGLVSCARFSYAPLTCYRALAEREVDLVVHLGDYIYEDDGDKGPRPHDPPHRATTLDDYRRRIAQVRTDTDAQALHERHPVVSVLDDHDLADNAWRNGGKGHDELRDGPWTARTEAALRARSEWLPSRGEASYRSLDLGEIGRLVLLDSRHVGRDQQAGDEGAKALDDPSRTILGEEQETWLSEQLADPRPWSILCNGVVVNPMRLPASVPSRMLPEDYASHDGEVLRGDLWDGYPAARDRLVAAIDARPGATLLVAGDVHSSWAFDGPSLDGRPVTNELVVPSVSSAPLGRTRLPGVWRVIDAAGRRMPGVVWSDITQRGFVHLRLTVDAAQATWHWVDPYATDAVPETTPARSMVVRAGTPRWHEATPCALPRSSGPALSPRPDDLPAIRRYHQRRRYGGLAALGLVPVVGMVVAGLRATRSR